MPLINGIILNNDGPTRVAERAGDTDSCIDITIVSVSVWLETSWKLLPLMGSDHRLTLTTIKRKKDQPLQRKKTQGFRYDTRKQSVICTLRRRVKVEREGKTRKKDEYDKPEWMTEEVDKIWKDKMVASKRYSQAKKDELGAGEVLRRKVEYNRLTALYQRTAERRRQEVWDRFCEENDPSDPKVASNFWKLAKSMGRKVTGTASAGPKVIKGLNGEWLTTDEEKGQAFLTRYLGQLQQQGEERANQAWNEADEHVKSTGQEVHEKPVTKHELDMVLQATKKTLLQDQRPLGILT